MITDESDFSALESVLAQAVDRARIIGRVELREGGEGGEGGTLELTLLGSSRLPFSLNTAARPYSGRPQNGPWRPTLWK